MKQPKEQANELIKKFLNITQYYGFIGNEKLMNKTEAKQCALVCVETVLFQTSNQHFGCRLSMIFWNEVKQEIINYE
jgi:hypothetical protein